MNVLIAAFLPTQGFFNFVVFIKPRFGAVRRNFPAYSRWRALAQAVWNPVAMSQRGQDDAGTREMRPRKQPQGTIDLAPVSVLESRTSQQLTGLSDRDVGVEASRASESGGFDHNDLDDDNGGIPSVSNIGFGAVVSGRDEGDDAQNADPASVGN
jgi:hypothetical protein